MFTTGNPCRRSYGGRAPRSTGPSPCGRLDRRRVQPLHLVEQRGEFVRAARGMMLSVPCNCCCTTACAPVCRRSARLRAPIVGPPPTCTTSRSTLPTRPSSRAARRLPRVAEIGRAHAAEGNYEHVLVRTNGALRVVVPCDPTTSPIVDSWVPAVALRIAGRRRSLQRLCDRVCSCRERVSSQPLTFAIGAVVPP